jgi:hypothetical protein
MVRVIYLRFHCSSITQNTLTCVLYTWSDMAGPRQVETFLSVSENAVLVIIIVSNIILEIPESRRGEPLLTQIITRGIHHFRDCCCRLLKTNFL